MKRLVLFICLTVLFLGAKAQGVGSWQIYPAYTVCTKNIPVGNRVYALMETKLMAYDSEDESIVTFDWMRQLNDVTITFMHYSAEARRLILIYDNGNIDLLSTEDDNDVINLAQLKNSTLQNKQVRNVQVVGSTAYVCTGFGLLCVDMSQGVVTNTYNLGLAVNACACTSDAIYIGTESGIWKGDTSVNLQEKSSWQQINTSIIPVRMEFFDQRLWAQQGSTVYLSDSSLSGFSAGLQLNATYLNVADDCLIAGNAQQVWVCSSATVMRRYTGTFAWSDLRRQGNKFWASDGPAGLQAYELADDNTFRLTTAGVHPNSPLHDYTYHLRFGNGRLLVAGGNRNYAYSVRPGTAMILDEGGNWINFDVQSVYDLLPDELFQDVTDIAQDPQDAQHHYVGTARNGIFEFRDGKCVGHIGYDNSPLRSILPDNSKPQNFVVGNGVQYDADGNMWVLNSRVDTIIHVMKPDGSWKSLYFEDIAGISAMDNILFDSHGYVWMNSRRVERRGIIQLDYNGTLDNVRDDKVMLRSSITNQDGSIYNPDEFYCMAEDLEGRVWVGTILGPFVVAQPDDFRTVDFTFEQVKVSRDDGSGLADYLLNGVPILSIALDGGGRFWFGSEGSGAYLISRDCQEEIQHFTTSNSPLISDNVFDIAVDHQTGRVFFATDKGLCSWLSDATEPAGELKEGDIVAFPNPVAPDYNGPIVVRGLTLDCEVKIVSSSGQLIWSGRSNGGTFTWDGRNKQGRRVASGIYHVVASDAAGNEAIVTRIAFIH